MNTCIAQRWHVLRQGELFRLHEFERECGILWDLYISKDSTACMLQWCYGHWSVFWVILLHEHARNYLKML